MNEIKTRLAGCLKQTPKVTALRLVKHALQPWVEWGTLVFLEQDLETTPAVPATVAHEIRELTAADVPSLKRYQRDQADLAWRLARGDRAFALFEAGTGVPLHVRWGTIAPTWIPEVELWLHPRPGEFYLYDVITHPVCRGQRFAGLVGSVMDEAFGNQGFRTKIGYVRKDNHAMLRSMQWARVPLRRLFDISYIRWAGREPFLLSKPQPPLSSKPS